MFIIIMIIFNVCTFTPIVLGNVINISLQNRVLLQYIFLAVNNLALYLNQLKITYLTEFEQIVFSIVMIFYSIRFILSYRDSLDNFKGLIIDVSFYTIVTIIIYSLTFALPIIKGIGI